MSCGRFGLRRLTGATLITTASFLIFRDACVCRYQNRASRSSFRPVAHRRAAHWQTGLPKGYFAAELTKAPAIEHYQLVKGFARDNGRSPDDVKILPGLLLSLGSMEEEARRRSDEIHDASPASYSVGWLSQAIGYDASKLELDEPFPEEILAPIKDAKPSLAVSVIANPSSRRYERPTRRCANICARPVTPVRATPVSSVRRSS